MYNIFESDLRKKILFFFLRLIGLIICFFLLLFFVDFNMLILSLKRLSGYIIVFALICAFFRLWLVSFRWRILNPDVVSQFKQWQYFRYIIISNIFNIFMPGALGGDIVRSLLVFRSVKKNRLANIFGILVDRFIGFCSIIMLGTMAFFFAPELSSRNQYLIILSIFIIVFLIIITIAISNSLTNIIVRLLRQLGRLGNKFISLIKIWQEVIRYYLKNPQNVFFAFLLCIPIHLLWFAIVYILSINIGINISFISISMITCIVWVITSLPLTFAGLGVRELSFVYLLSLQGISAESAAALSLYQFAIIVLVAMIGLPFIWIGNLKPTQIKDKTPVPKNYTP